MRTESWSRRRSLNSLGPWESNMTRACPQLLCLCYLITLLLPLNNHLWIICPRSLIWNLLQGEEKQKKKKRNLKAKCIFKSKGICEQDSLNFSFEIKDSKFFKTAYFS